MHAIVEGAAEQTDDDARRIAALYASFMDVERVEALGIEPLRPLLDEIAAAPDHTALARVLGRRQREGRASLVGSFVSTDAKDPNRYLVHLNQSGLGLPDESYYREESYAEIRTAYIAHLERLADLLGLPDPARLAESVMDLETALAAASWDRVSNRDAEKTYTLMTGAELRERAPAFAWDAWLDGLGAPDGRVRRGRGAPAELRRGGREAVAGAPARAMAGVAEAPHRVGVRRLPVRRDRPAGLRLLRPHALGHPPDQGPLEARGRARRGVGGRGRRAAVRATALPGVVQGTDDHARRAPRRGLPAEHLHPGLDGPGHPRAGAGEARQVHPQDRLPGRVGGLLRARGARRRPARQRLRAGALAHRPRARQDRQAGRPRRVVHDPADRQRLLPPAAQRDRVPGRDPAAAVLRPRRRRRGQLRRHRRGDRARDRPRLRRPGQQVRRRRRHDRLVGGRRPRGVRPPRPGAHRPVLGAVPREPARPQGQRRADRRREHRRPRRPHHRAQGVQIALDERTRPPRSTASPATSASSSAGRRSGASSPARRRPSAGSRSTRTARPTCAATPSSPTSTRSTRRSTCTPATRCTPRPSTACGSGDGIEGGGARHRDHGRGHGAQPRAGGPRRRRVEPQRREGAAAHRRRHHRRREGRRRPSRARRSW